MSGVGDGDTAALSSPRFPHLFCSVLIVASRCHLLPVNQGLLQHPDCCLCHPRLNLQPSFPSSCPWESGSPGFLCGLGKLPGGGQPIKQSPESRSQLFPSSRGTKARTQHANKALLCLEGSQGEEVRGSAAPPHGSGPDSSSEHAGRGSPIRVCKE